MTDAVPDGAEVAFASARDLARWVADGTVTSRAAVQAYLDRIERFNPTLGAVVTVDADAALRRADECDRAVAAGLPLGPLHGVPMTVKDAFETAGMRTTAGLEEYADHVPQHNAAAVGRLVDAGAVIMGKTNCPAGVTGQETANELFGRTNNPWDTDRTSGASSGGAAAALAAGLTALELGSDSGGSIRQPASYCGVYGHFPTQGLVPSRGHIPQVDRSEVDVHIDLMSVGPMARHPADLALAMGVLVGPDLYGSRAWRLQLPPPPASIRDYRVGVWLDDGDYPVDAAVVDRLEATAAALVDAGVHVDRRARPAFRLADAERVAFALWVASSSQRNSDEHDAEMRRRAAAFAADDQTHAARRARAEILSHREWLLLDAERRRLQRRWEDLFTSVDVLLCPVTPVVAFPHDPKPHLVADIDHRAARTIQVNGQPRPYLDQLVWTTVVGMARLPSTVAPVGHSGDGMPVGVQIVGRALADRTTIAFADQLQRLIGGFDIPPAYGRDHSQPAGSRE